MTAPMKVYVLSAAAPGDPEPLWQRRVYSKRDEAIEEFGKLADQHPDVYSTIDAVTMDEHHDWEFGS